MEERVAKLERWAAEHDGRINAWWEAQHQWNAKAEARMDTFSLRLLAIEKRMMWVAGFAAAVGAFVGNFVS